MNFCNNNESGPIPVLHAMGGAVALTATMAAVNNDMAHGSQFSKWSSSTQFKKRVANCNLNRSQSQIMKIVGIDSKDRRTQLNKCSNRLHRIPYRGDITMRNKYTTQKAEGGRMIEAKMAIANTIEKFPELLIKRIGLAVRGSLIFVKRKKSNKIMTSIKNGNFKIGY
ncbi:hypothetical protein LWI28_021053 [Acer negundo]|uniref:Uncharacterized protein n=1 Tax=Acer negundo TaxID=4023 RepID=A0AAD5IRT3_ACENE|nr:hypothetical protein LWI28_021053 [Acer negundo]